jgi:hypothetical protein
MAFGGASREKIFSSYESIDGKLADIQKRLGQQQDALTGTLAVDIQQLHAKIDYMYAQVTRLAEHSHVEMPSVQREAKTPKAQSYDPKILAKLTELDRLDRLESLSKLSALSKLDDLDKLDRLEKLDKLDRLDDLEQLKQLENLGYLKRLDLLNDIKLSLPSVTAQSPKPLIPEQAHSSEDMGRVLESLKKLSMLDRIDRAQQIMLAKMEGPHEMVDDAKVGEISKRFIELVGVYREQNKVLRAQNEALQTQLKEFSNDLKTIINIISQGQQEAQRKRSPKSQV